MERATLEAGRMGLQAITIMHIINDESLKWDNDIRNKRG